MAHLAVSEMKRCGLMREYLARECVPVSVAWQARRIGSHIFIRLINILILTLWQCHGEKKPPVDCHLHLVLFLQRHSWFSAFARHLLRNIANIDLSIDSLLRADYYRTERNI